jgi:hypothetical protein
MTRGITEKTEMLPDSRQEGDQFRRQQPELHTGPSRQRLKAACAIREAPSIDVGDTLLLTQGRAGLC